MKHGRWIAGVIAALACLAAAVLIVILFLNSSEQTPPVHLSPPLSEAEGEGGSSSHGVEDAPIFAELRPDTVQYALSTIEKPENYSCRYTVESYWEGGSSVCQVSVSVRKGLLRVTQQQGEQEKNFLLTDEDYYVWYGEGEEVYHGKRGDLLSGAEIADAVQMSGSYPHLMELPISAILEVAYLQEDGLNCIYVSAREGELGYTNDYYISPETGLLQKNLVYDGEKLIYSLRAEEIVLSAPEESVFLLPESEQDEAG